MLGGMWAEIIVSRDDLARLLAQAFPLTIHLGEPGSEHSLSLSDLGEVRLVAELGLRVHCKARVHWPVLGVDVPVSLNSLTLMLLPSIGRSAEGDTLAFRVTLEHADFSSIPTLIDKRITDVINTKLASESAQLTWNFAKTLTQAATLPAMLEPLEQFVLRPAWGKVRVNEEAVVYAVSFHTALVRSGQVIPHEFDAGAAPLTRPPGAAPLRPPQKANARQLATFGMFGLGAGAAYFVLKASFGSRS